MTSKTESRRIFYNTNIHTTEILGGINYSMSEKHVVKTFLTGKISATLIIPIELARKCGLAEPTHVIIEAKDDGIFIRKLEI